MKPFNQPTIKHFDVNMDIRNLSQLPHGTGSRYLEVIESHEVNAITGIGYAYIAKQWRNVLPKDNGNILIQF
jgi:hypothetical protein